MASYGGFNIFGFAVHVEGVSDPAETQESAYSQVSGVFSLHHGGRGGRIVVRGCWVESDANGCFADKVLMETYNDGIARQLVDTIGNTYNNVLFVNVVAPGPYMAAPGGMALEYTANFRVLL